VGRLFGLAMMLVALYLAATLYARGVRETFGGAFDPIQSGSERDGSAAVHLTPAAQLADPPADAERRVWVTEAVREQVQVDLEQGARRRGY
jgi:hypothetical protein